MPGESSDPATPAASDDTQAGVVPGTAAGGPTGGEGGDPAAGGTGGQGPVGPDPVGLLASAVGSAVFGRPQLPLGLLLTMTTTTTVVGAALAFSVFGKRRRDGEPPAPDEVLAAAAATGVGLEAAAPGGANGGPADPLALEMAMPRWRRPSLLEARKADPIRDAAPAPRLTFDHGLVGPIDGRERRLIRYNVVRLLDQPDELRGAEIGFLDNGDEVQLLEKHGVYWLVLCPDGRQGWIHKMTLGETVAEAPVQSAATATMPIDAETWTMGDDVDGDVLAAYLESRRRS